MYSINTPLSLSYNLYSNTLIPGRRLRRFKGEQVACLLASQVGLISSMECMRSRQNVKRDYCEVCSTCSAPMKRTLFNQEEPYSKLSPNSSCTNQWATHTRVGNGSGVRLACSATGHFGVLNALLLKQDRKLLTEQRIQRSLAVSSIRSKKMQEVLGWCPCRWQQARAILYWFIYIYEVKFIQLLFQPFGWSVSVVGAPWTTFFVSENSLSRQIAHDQVQNLAPASHHRL